MTDIIERLKEPEVHYPGNFNTPKRANAMLSCLCQEAAEEIEQLRQQIADRSQPRQKAIEAAYQLLLDFQAVINTSLEGDHPMAEPVDRWLSWYERNDN